MALPAYRWHFDARALTPVRATALRRRLPPRQVRGRPEARLRADVPLRPGADRAAAMDEAPTPRSLWPRRQLSSRGRWPRVRSAVTRRRGDRGHVDARARARPRASRCSSRRASSRCSTPSGSARCRSRSRATSTGRSCTRCARSAPSRRRSAAPSAGRARRARAVRQRLAGRGGARRRRDRDRRRDRARAAAPGASTSSSVAARELRRGGAALRQPHAGRAALRARARALAQAAPGRRDRGRGGLELARQGRLRRRSSSRAPASTRPRRPRSSAAPRS